MVSALRQTCWEMKRCALIMHFMEDNNKDIISSDTVAEPVGAIAVNADNKQLYGIDHWPGMPIVGPTDIEEAHARIDEAEHEIDGNGGMDWTEFKSMLAHRHASSYAI